MQAESVKKAVDRVPVLVRIPSSLLKKLDRERERNSRSRTAEVCLRLTSSFRKAKA